VRNHHDLREDRQGLQRSRLNRIVEELAGLFIVGDAASASQESPHGASTLPTRALLRSAISRLRAACAAS